MKRRDPIAHLEKHGCVLKRDDGKHSVYWHPVSNRTAPVARHREITDKMAKVICRQLGIPEP